MSDNPFAEPGDADRTVIRPMPGGSRAATRPPPSAAIVSGPGFDASAGDGPLAIAAAPLLMLLARLRNTAAPPDPDDMRERTRRELRAFERRAGDAGVPADQIRMAQYALCAALDDVVLSSPWGKVGGHGGGWHDRPLARELYDDADAGRGFFDQLRTLRGALPDARPVLEIMYLCLSLGMMGPFRDAPDGIAAVERARHHVFELIGTAAPAVPATLAPEAGGLRVAPPPTPGVPVWVAACAALALLAAAYAWSLLGLNARSDEVYRAALATEPSNMPALIRPPDTPPPPPPPEPPPGPVAALRAALADVADVELVASPGAAILRIPAHVLFAQPTATLTPGPVLDRVAAALVPLPGPVRVLAYTDTTPVRSVRFPSNFALAAARAKAVRAALARTVPPARLTADGRADADPIAPNTTADGRERNRRIDIVVGHP